MVLPAVTQNTSGGRCLFISTPRMCGVSQRGKPTALVPETKQIRLTHGIDDEPTIDYTRLNDEELDQRENLFERAKIPAGTGEDRKGPAEL